MNILEFSLGLFLWAILIPLFGPILLFFIVFKSSVEFIASFYNLIPLPVTSTQLYTSPSGEIWALLTGALKVEDKVNVVSLRKLFKEKFLSNPKESIFYREVVHFMGYAFTKIVPKIDLNFHIREIESGEDSTLTKLWMDNASIEQRSGGTPPWEILVCNNIKGEKGALIAIKIHHCLADGYSFVSIIDTLTGNKSPYIVKPWKLSTWRKVKMYFNLPLGFIQQLWGYDVGLVQHPFSLEDKEEETKLIPTLVSTVTLDFRKLKEIRKVVGCRMLPIFMCIHVRAIERYLLDSGKINEGTKYKEYFRHTVNLPKPDHPAIRENRHYNHVIWGAGKVPLAEPDLMIRLQKTNIAFESYEENDWEKVDAILAPLPGLLPSSLIHHFQNIRKYPMFSTLSTLILSPDQYYLQEKEIKNLYFGTTFDLKIAGFRGVTLFTFTRGNDVDACVVASEDVFSNQNEIDRYATKYLVEALEEYSEICKNKRL